MRRLALRLACVAGLIAAAPAVAQAPVNAGPYVPTPWVILDEMLKVAALKPDDLLLDLGSGDGRLPIEAVRRYGAAGGVGVELDERLVALATENAEKARVGDRVRFVRGDLFKADLSQASVVTVYLLPNTVTQLVAKMLAEMKPGARIVAHDYPLVPWQADKVATFEFQEKVPISGSSRTVLYHYTVPARVAGAWDLQLPGRANPVRIDLRQEAGLASGQASAGGRTWALAQVGVRGESIRLVIPGLGAGGRALTLDGRVAGGTMSGTADQDEARGPWTAKRAGPAQ